MEYNWIDTESVPCIREGERIILFGGGQGTVELLHYLMEQKMHPQILGVADNDSTMWGKLLHGLPVVAPHSVPSMRWDRIIITTISGREHVARQLQAMGYEEGTHFCRVGAYPQTSIMNLLILLDMQARHEFLHQGDEVLHIGPGGFLCLETALHCLGFRPHSMDAYSFAVHYPDVTRRMAQYRSVLDFILRQPAVAAVGEDVVRARFAELFSEDGEGRVFVDTSKLPYTMPARYSAIPLPDASRHAVCSFAVLEHVRNPEAAVRETRRILKPGGHAVHRILTRDHRSFSVVEGYHPFSYLNESEEGWEAVNRDKFYQNRLLPEQWKALFEANGFEVLEFRPLEIYRLSPDQVEALHPDFKTPDGKLPPDFTGAVSCDMLARKVR